MAGVDGILAQVERLIGAGQAEQARAVLQRALQKSPADADLNSAMCFVCQRLGQGDQAAYFGGRALSARPADASFAANIGRILTMAGRHDDAARAFERAVSAGPALLEGWTGLARAHFQAGRLGECEAVCRRALEAHPDHPRLTDLLGSCVRKAGRLREAYEIVRRGAAAHPGDLILAQERAFNSNYPSGLSAEEVFEAHRAFGALAAASARPLGVARPGAGDAERRLRVGFMSPDFRTHSVAFYAEPLVESLDRSSFDVLIYHTHGVQDGVTARFRAMAGAWCEAAALSDEALTQRIASDRVDILVELAGLTNGCRPGVLVRKPAPVIVTYLGYPNTTGMPTVDYRFIDSVTDPPPPWRSDALATERLVRLDPCFLCYRPAADAPEVGPLPCLSGGPFTFGSFNAGMKFSDACVALWAGVLKATPGSRLLLKNFDLSLPEVRRHVAERFEACGVGPERVEMLSYTPTAAEHLGLYRRVDLGLDTYPYHGTTTTCEAFHMGVPVVTLEGAVHASRVGSTLLRAVGLAELIARDEDEFVRIASAMASDRPRLAALRAEMRGRQSSSALGDAPGFGARFGAALRRCWREACGAGPAGEEGARGG